MPMLDFDAVIFDLDGVLIDSEPLHERAKQVVVDAHGLEVPTEAFEAFLGKTDRDIFTYIVDTYGDGTADVEALIDAKQAAYRDLIGELTMVDGARAFLEAVAARYPTALATSAVRRNQELAFERFDLMPFFEAVVVAEDLTHHKPHPEPYLTAAAGLARPPERCLVLEDSVNGIRSARAAGCTAVGLTTSFPADALREAGAHHVADSFAALADLFGRQPGRR